MQVGAAVRSSYGWAHVFAVSFCFLLFNFIYVVFMVKDKQKPSIETNETGKRKNLYFHYLCLRLLPTCTRHLLLLSQPPGPSGYKASPASSRGRKNNNRERKSRNRRTRCRSRSGGPSQQPVPGAHPPPCPVYLLLCHQRAGAPVVPTLQATV